MIASADNIPIKNNIYDYIICTEVIEHLLNPEKTLQEIFRVLKNNASLILSVPFMFQLHSEPVDFQRWTKYKLENELMKNGFANIKIIAMGSYFAVLYDVINSFLHLSNSIHRKITRKILNYFFKIFLWLDKNNNYSKITTGYFVIANKNLQNQ